MKNFNLKSEDVFEYFVELCNTLPRVAYDPSWANGTGYFDGAVNAKVEGPSTFTEPSASGRRGVIIPMKYVYSRKKDVAIPLKGRSWRNVIIFERFTPGGGPEVLVSNQPFNISCFQGAIRPFDMALACWFSDGLPDGMSKAEFAEVYRDAVLSRFGEDYPNIDRRLEKETRRVLKLIRGEL